jgi:nucleotide-binding universal stress UspA family protein
MSGDSYRTSRPVTVAVGQAEHGDAAVRWAAAEAASRRTSLRVVHAYEWQPGPVWAGRLRPVPDSVPGEARQAATARLAEAVRQGQAAEAGLTVTGVLAEGPAVDVLRDEARTAQLLVLGGSEHGAGIGSMVRSVAERAGCPVVVIPRSVRRHQSARVVVGLDLTHHSDAALTFGFEIADRWQAILEVVYCWQPDLMDSQNLLEPVVIAEKAAFEQQLCDELAPWLQKYPGQQVVATVLERRPVTGLTERADAADLLVLGRPGSHPVRASLGSVHLAALHRAGCPVALVPSGRSE